MDGLFFPDGVVVLINAVGESNSLSTSPGWQQRNPCNIILTNLKVKVSTICAHQHVIADMNPCLSLH